MKPVKIIIALLFFACAGTQLNAQGHGSYDIDLTRFQSDGRTVDIEYAVTVHPSAVPRKESVFVQFCLGKEENRLMPLSSFVINGKQRAWSYKRASALGLADGEASAPGRVFSSGDPGEKMIYRHSIAYEDWMDNAAVYVKEATIGCRNKWSETGRMLARMTMILPPVEVEPPAPPVVEPPVQERQRRMVEGKLNFNFPVNSTVLDMNFGRNAYEWGTIIHQIMDIESDANKRIIMIELTGFASPEGPYEHNARLSAGRARAVADRLLQSEAIHLTPDRITTDSVAEDWDGLVSLLENSNIPRKQEVLDIIRNVGVFDGREKALMELNQGRVYRILLRDYFPQLRRTEYQIIYEE